MTKVNSTDKPLVSVRGYYYDLSLSPYVFHTSYGEYRFPSAKKFDVFIKELSRLSKRLADSLNFIHSNTDTRIRIIKLEQEMIEKLYEQHKKKF